MYPAVVGSQVRWAPGSSSSVMVALNLVGCGLRLRTQENGSVSHVRHPAIDTFVRGGFGEVAIGLHQVAAGSRSAANALTVSKVKSANSVIRRCNAFPQGLKPEIYRAALSARLRSRPRRESLQIRSAYRSLPSLSKGQYPKTALP